MKTLSLLNGLPSTPKKLAHIQMTRIQRKNGCFKKSINQMHSEQKGKCDCSEPEGFSDEVAFEQGVEGEVKSY